MTHTYVEMEVPAALHQFVLNALQAAGYAQAIHADADATRLDMQGIALIPIPPLPVDPDDDIGPFFACYAWHAGQTLTVEDVAHLQQVLREHNDMIGEQADLAHNARMDAFREIGGDELVAIMEAGAGERVDDVVRRILAKERIDRIGKLRDRVHDARVDVMSAHPADTRALAEAAARLHKAVDALYAAEHPPEDRDAAREQIKVVDPTPGNQAGAE